MGVTVSLVGDQPVRARDSGRALFIGSNATMRSLSSSLSYHEVSKKKDHQEVWDGDIIHSGFLLLKDAGFFSTTIFFLLWMMLLFIF